MKKLFKNFLSYIVMAFEEIFKPKSEKKRFIQYTKKFVTIITMFACIWVTWSYYLATYALKVYGSFEPLQELSKDITNSIIFVGLGYFAKSFAETYCEKKMETIQPKQERYDGV